MQNGTQNIKVTAAYILLLEGDSICDEVRYMSRKLRVVTESEKIKCRINLTAINYQNAN